MKAHMNYISKEFFLFGFKEARKAAISEANIKSAFRSTGLVSLGPTKVLNHRSIEPRTSLIAVESRTNVGIQNTTKYERTELHITLVKKKIRVHQNSSLTPINDGLDKIVNYTAQIMSYHKRRTRLLKRSGPGKIVVVQRLLRFLSRSLVRSFEI
jgi:hypothetical protein